MSNNYYKVFIPTEEQINELQRCTEELQEIRNGTPGDPNKIIDDMRDLLDMNPPIHICKMSFGWKTGFDHNWGKYYDITRKSIDEFLRKSDGYLVDEYGEKVDVDDFWKLVDKRDSDPKAYTSETYSKAMGEFPTYDGESRRKVKEKFGIDTMWYDFESDGLRFSTFSDFL